MVESSSRRELMQAFRKMRDLPPDERQKFLASSEDEKRFSPQERDLLARLNKLLPEGREAPLENEEPQR